MYIHFQCAVQEILLHFEEEPFNKTFLNTEYAVAYIDGRTAYIRRRIDVYSCSFCRHRQMKIIRRILIKQNSLACCKTDLVQYIFMRVAELVKFMLIVTAAFLCFHAAFTALVTGTAVEFGAYLLPHAIMYLHSNTRSCCHVNHRQYCKKEFLHYCKDKKLSGSKC